MCHIDICFLFQTKDSDILTFTSKKKMSCGWKAANILEKKSVQSQRRSALYIQMWVSQRKPTSSFPFISLVARKREPRETLIARIYFIDSDEERLSSQQRQQQQLLLNVDVDKGRRTNWRDRKKRRRKGRNEDGDRQKNRHIRDVKDMRLEVGVRGAKWNSTQRGEDSGRLIVVFPANMRQKGPYLVMLGRPVPSCSLAVMFTWISSSNEEKQLFFHLY